MPQPLSESDILFPHLQNPSFSTTLSSLKRSALSIHNRLFSITSDSSFVSSVSTAYALPLVANERCGSWYIPPDEKVEGVYFKSTDGHMGEWSFSLRRLNLQLLGVVSKYGGAVVVDSTRRGKSMPDALSKTVPIWCCVINRAVFGGDHKMYTPPQAVSESEHAQIEGRIDGFVKQFLDICKPRIPELRERLRKPLRPIWVTQQSSLPDLPPAFADFHPIVLCTASRRVHGAEVSEGGYVQGAADDHEAWSHGLTPPVFWQNTNLLLSTNEGDAPSLIAKLLAEKATAGSMSASVTLINPTSTLYISPSDNVSLEGFDVIISCTPHPFPAETLKSAKVKHYLHLKCQTGKLGSRDLRNELALLPDFIDSLPSSLTTSSKILISCPTGKDLSVGTALAILCFYANDDGGISFAKKRSSSEIDKNFIKHRLSWITTSNPALNPSRSTLQSVNAILLTSQDPKAVNLPIRSKSHAVDKTAAKSAMDEQPSSRGLEGNSTSDSSPLPSLPNRVFANLTNNSGTSWTFTRTLTSALSTHPSGTVSGTARFVHCSLPSSFPPTLLYAEEGEFVTNTGFKMNVRRKYVYQLTIDTSITITAEGGKGEEIRDNGNDGGGRKEGIVVKFFDDENFGRAEKIGENGEGVGGVFVEMGPLIPPTSAATTTSTSTSTMTAKNKERHLCGEDLYAASWKFSPTMFGHNRDGGEAEGEDKWWEVTYEVKGPKKDYVSVTRYTI